jgi:hypothetical protein
MLRSDSNIARRTTVLSLPPENPTIHGRGMLLRKVLVLHPRYDVRPESRRVYIVISFWNCARGHGYSIEQIYLIRLGQWEPGAGFTKFI